MIHLVPTAHTAKTRRSTRTYERHLAVEASPRRSAVCASKAHQSSPQRPSAGTMRQASHSEYNANCHDRARTRRAPIAKRATGTPSYSLQCAVAAPGRASATCIEQRPNEKVGNDRPPAKMPPGRTGLQVTSSHVSRRSSRASRNLERMGSRLTYASARGAKLASAHVMRVLCSRRAARFAAPSFFS